MENTFLKSLIFIFKSELTAPLNLTGDISARYMGANPAFKPELIPIKNLPNIISSYEPAFFEAPLKRLENEKIDERKLS